MSRLRAAGALYGLAIGDALGMPTQMLPREQVRSLLGDVRWFEAGPSANPISAGQPAGKVTDDTEQALIVARLLVQGDGRLDVSLFVQELLAWTREAESDGSEQLGPSSRRALEAVARGVAPSQAGSRGDTNGAAMRIAPVGICVPPEPLSRLVDHVEQVCLPTHHTGLAIAGAAAVAAVVSVGVEGGSFEEGLQLALRAAQLGQQRGHYVAGPSVAERISWAVSLVKPLDESSAQERIYNLVGTGVLTQESVPAAFALASLYADDPWEGCLAAASLGGDSDTIGAITGAMLGACCGESAFPSKALALVREVNSLYVDELVAALLSLRQSIVGR